VVLVLVEAHIYCPHLWLVYGVVVGFSQLLDYGICGLAGLSYGCLCLLSWQCHSISFGCYEEKDFGPIKKKGWEKVCVSLIRIPTLFYQFHFDL